MAELTIEALDAIGDARRVAVTIMLCDPDRNEVVGFTGDGAMVSRTRTHTDAEGVLVVDIPSNTSDIDSPSGTLYLVTVGDKPFLIEKDDTAQTLREALAEDPDPIGPTALQAHLDDDEGAHAAAAILVEDDDGHFDSDEVEGALEELAVLAEGVETVLNDTLAASDPFAQYQKESEKGQASGYASLDGGGTVPDAQIPAAIARDSEVTAAISAHAGGVDQHGDRAYTDSQIAALIGTAPSTLDTLGEISDALNDDANAAATLTSLIGTKVAKAGDTMSGTLAIVQGTASAVALSAKVTGDAFNRFAVAQDGTVSWASGSAAADLKGYRGSYTNTAGTTRTNVLIVQSLDAAQPDGYLVVRPEETSAGTAAVVAQSAAGAAQMVIRRSNGTPAAPTALLTGEHMGIVSWHGHDGTSFKSAGDIRMTASENWAVGANGAYMLFTTIPIGSTTVTERMRISSGGTVQVGSTTAQASLGTVELLRVGSPTTVDNAASVILRPAATTTKPLVVQGIASQAVNLTEWQTSAGAVRSYVDSSGNLVGPAPINAQTGTTYTLALTDAGTLVTLNNAAAIVLTIDTNANVAFPTGTIIFLAQLGAGQVQVAAAGGVTLTSTPGVYLRAQYSQAALIKTGTNTWQLCGDLST